MRLPLYTLLPLALVPTARAFPGEPQPFPASGIQWPAAGPNHALLDVDGDGRLDVVLASDLAPKLVIARGDGFGNVTSVNELALPKLASELAVADLDADGRQDLIVRSGIDGLLPLYSDGLGSFTVGTELVCPQPSPPVAGDFDGDGDIDVAAIAKASDQILVFPRIPGGHGAPIASAVDATATLLTMVDFDVDGDSDAITSAGTSIAIRLNDGAGVFAAQQSIPVVSINATALLAFDFENDGDIDLVRFGGIGWALRNDGVSGFVEANTLVTSSGVGTSIRTQDDDADGDLDLWVLGNNSVLDRFENRGDGFFDPPVAKNRIGAASEFRFVSESIDGDRRFDVVGASSAGSIEHGIVEVVRGGESGELEIGLVPPPVVNGGSWISRARIDGDALDDLYVISGNQILAYRGVGGSVALVSSVQVGSAPALFNRISVADLDGDGRDELVFRNSLGSATEINVIQNDGTGQLSVLAPQVVNFPPFDIVDFGDLDGDGDADCVAVGSLSAATSTRTVLSNQANVFSIVSQIAFPTTLGTDLADLNADGFTDLLVSENPTQTMSPAGLYLGNGNLGFGGRIAVASALPGGGITRSIRAADWNGDGSLDVIYTHLSLFSGWRIQVLTQGPGSTFQAAVDTAIPDLQAISSVVDVDADGKLDVELNHGRTIAQLAGGGFDVLRLAGPTQYATLANLDADPEFERVHLTHPASVNVLDASCAGAGTGRFGHACTGLGGFAPKLSLTGCPNPGGNVVLDLERGPGGSIAILLFATEAAPQPFAANCAFELGGTVLPLAPILPLAGTGAGAGAISVPAILAANLPPFTVAIQAFVADSSRATGYTTSNGIELVVR